MANQKCYKNGRLSADARMNNYPFNKAGKVVFISYEGATGGTPVKNGIIDSSRIKEIKYLNKKQINELTDLVFNYNYSKKTTLTVHTTSGCYIPRHAILFTDQMNRVFAYIEICFECERYESSEERGNLRIMCANKLDLLENLFKAVGLTTTFVPFNEQAPDPALQPFPDKHE